MGKRLAQIFLITKMRIKTTMRYSRQGYLSLMPTTIARIKIMGNKSWWTCGEFWTATQCCWEWRLCSSLLQKSLAVPQRVKELPYNPVVLLLGICKTELKTGIQIFMHKCPQEQLYAITKKWKQPKCPTNPSKGTVPVKRNELQHTWT